MILHLAHTTPINPASSSSPPLTRTQIWAGLQRKIRHAEEFVPVIDSCTVLSDEAGVVVRDVRFKAGRGAKEKARETVKTCGMSWVDFEQEDGTHIRNVISEGAGGEADLYMTYMFEFALPHIEEGSEDAEKEEKRLKGMAKGAVESSIDAIREMVKDGRITG
jgi:hypothetical protein